MAPVECSLDSALHEIAAEYQSQQICHPSSPPIASIFLARCVLLWQDFAGLSGAQPAQMKQAVQKVQRGSTQSVSRAPTHEQEMPHLVDL
jgi:hypothetical protein